MSDHPLIDLRSVYKAYETVAGGFMALKDINLTIDPGQFVGVIGKSGSGKSTLINMITGIDRPTSGEVWVAGSPIHTYNENQMARWRGDTLGIVFQFFQLVPGISVINNIMLPLDLRGRYDRATSRRKALDLLDRVGLVDHAEKRPTELSGGQQQRVAIARALINDPAILVADEPTGSLDTATANTVFALFEEIAAAGTTILIVTHDDQLAQRTERTVLLTDGVVVNEWLARALPMLSAPDLLAITQMLNAMDFLPGEPIITQESPPDRFYIITEGHADVHLMRPDGHAVYVETLGPGQYFGEMALLHGGVRTAGVRASDTEAVQVVALEYEEFNQLVEQIPALRPALQQESARRMQAQVDLWADWFTRRDLS